MRTTIDIDSVLLKELKRLQREQRRSLGELVSELLAAALKERRSATRRKPFRLKTYRLGPARVDLDDKATLSTLDGVTYRT